MNNDQYKEIEQALETEPDNLIELPQVSPATGLTNDYNNEVAALFSVYDSFGFDGLKEYFPNFRIKKYSERYPEDKYKNVITEQNRAAVEELDRLVDGINLDLAQLDELKAKDLMDKVDRIILIVRGS